MDKAIPNKLFFKIGEVCEITDTQPYVLRYWESEFPALAPRKNRAGNRVYQGKDIKLIFLIKHLLYEEGYTIAGAKKKLARKGAMESTQDLPLLESRKDELIESIRRDLQGILKILP